MIGHKPGIHCTVGQVRKVKMYFSKIRKLCQETPVSYTHLDVYKRQPPTDKNTIYTVLKYAVKLVKILNLFNCTCVVILLLLTPVTPTTVTPATGNVGIFLFILFLHSFIILLHTTH